MEHQFSLTTSDRGSLETTRVGKSLKSDFFYGRFQRFYYHFGPFHPFSCNFEEFVQWLKKVGYMMHDQFLYYAYNLFLILKQLFPELIPREWIIFLEEIKYNSFIEPFILQGRRIWIFIFCFNICIIGKNEGLGYILKLLFWWIVSFFFWLRVWKSFFTNFINQYSPFSRNGSFGSF